MLGRRLMTRRHEEAAAPVGSDSLYRSVKLQSAEASRFLERVFANIEDS